MNGKRLYIIAALTVAVAMVLIVPVYAFTTSVSVNDNTVTSNERVVDIENQTEPFSITPPTFANVSTPVSITNHTLQLAADGNVSMRAWLYLNDNSGWLILDYAELKIYNVTNVADVLADGEVQKYILNGNSFEEVDQNTVDATPSGTYYVKAYDLRFGEGEISTTGTEIKRYQSTIPTASMTLDPTITYKFDLVFHFKDLVGEDLYNLYRGNFNGKITFAINNADKDPLTPDA